MNTTIRSSAPPGRNGEHERALAAVRLGGGVVIVGFPAGGRSTLAAAVARDAEASGASTVWVAASASLRKVPFGAFASLLHEAPARSNDDHRAVRCEEESAHATTMPDGLRTRIRGRVRNRRVDFFAAAMTPGV